ncbi:MAG: hypothetical protein AAF745_01350 [Planctomycetota bacterium]
MDPSGTPGCLGRGAGSNVGGGLTTVGGIVDGGLDSPGGDVIGSDGEPLWSPGLTGFAGSEDPGSDDPGAVFIGGNAKLPDCITT